ncbi:MAG: membrane protein insertion efficiency factor YidD [candidate division Zixibacteria bacterium]|nr:membrane protein insertion efficiency factor YidD [candidate division Zixibacteria bacterium]
MSRAQSPAAKILLGLIRFYRLVISPFLAWFIACRHYPTCSQYGLEAVSRYGAMRGGWMTIKRILRCNPLFPGGYDPVK